MPVAAVTPDAGTQRILADADFADAYRLVIADATLDAPLVARRIVARAPAWIRALTAIRNAAVAPLGLKTPHSLSAQPVARIGFFPVLSEAPERVVLGLDDRHLDFRLIVDVVPLAQRRQVTLTTVVRTHNEFGRAYLATILPFHRFIVRTMLRRIAKS